MAGSVKISQLIEAPVVGPNDSIPIARGGIETFRTPAGQFVTQAVNIGVGPGQLFSLKTASTPTTLQFRTLSAVGENLAIATVSDTVVFEMSGQTPYKRSFIANGTQTTYPLSPFNSVNAANYRVDIDGVLQEPFVNYSLSANHIVFASPPPLSGKIVIVSSNVVRLNEAIVAPQSVETEMLKDGTITTVKLSSSFYNSDSNYLVLPTVSAVSALDTGAPKGAVSYTNDTGQIYLKNQSGWIAATGRLGSIMRPAPNAQAIIDAGDSIGDGSYWIESLTGPVLTYCDMTNGGYMLAAVLESSTSTLWTYNGALWTSITPYQENETAIYKTGTGGATGGITAALNSLNRIFYEYTLTTGVRCCLGNKNNALAYAFTGNTAQSLFTTASPVNTRYTTFTRQAWFNWFQNGTGVNPSTVPGALAQGFQPNCNQEGFNLNYAYVNGARFGINFNEQNDCSSCDSAMGFGTNIGTPGSNPAIQSGGYTFSPQNIYRANGYIFIK